MLSAQNFGGYIVDSSSEVVISTCDRCEDTLKAPIDIGPFTLHRRRELLSKAGWEAIYLTHIKGDDPESYLKVTLNNYCPECAIIVKAYRRLR